MIANIAITLQEEKEQAKKSGKIEEKLEVAKKAIAKGLDDQMIIDLTELTIEEIQSFRESL